MLALALTVVAACEGAGGVRSVRPEQMGGNYPYGDGHASGDTQAGADFARWVLDQDPSHRYMTDAIVRGEQALGVKVQPDVTRAGLRQLLTSLTEGMARMFPARDLAVTAFYQNGDRLAELRYDADSGRIALRFV